MADTAKSIYGPAQLTNSATTIYTVPGATTTTILDIQVCNTTATSARLTISIGADAAGTRLVSGVNVPANGEYTRKGFIVMTAAEILQAYSDTSSALTITVSGVEST